MALPVNLEPHYGLANADISISGTAPSFEDVYRAVAVTEGDGLVMKVHIAAPIHQPQLTPADREHIEKVLAKVKRSRQPSTHFKPLPNVPLAPQELHLYKGRERLIICTSVDGRTLVLISDGPCGFFKSACAVIESLGGTVRKPTAPVAKR